MVNPLTRSFLLSRSRTSRSIAPSRPLRVVAGRSRLPSLGSPAGSDEESEPGTSQPHARLRSSTPPVVRAHRMTVAIRSLWARPCAPTRVRGASVPDIPSPWWAPHSRILLHAVGPSGKRGNSPRWQNVFRIQPESADNPPSRGCPADATCYTTTSSGNLSQSGPYTPRSAMRSPPTAYVRGEDGTAPRPRLRTAPQSGLRGMRHVFLIARRSKVSPKKIIPERSTGRPAR